MKVTKFTSLLVIGLALSLAGVGCKHRPVRVTEIPGSKAGVGEAGPGNAVGGGAEGTNGTSEIAANSPDSHKGWTEDAETLKADSVHFAYDSSVVRESEKSKVSAVADYLKSNAAAALRVEGNCDERGTAEYNRSLGDRRALAVREELAGLGIDPTRVDTISYGKDRPVDTGHSEESHSRNRRDDFVLLTKPQ